MEDRPRRKVTKRYQATSSDKAPERKKTATASHTTTGRIEDDIGDIKSVLIKEEKDTNINDNNLINRPMQAGDVQSQSHVQYEERLPYCQCAYTRQTEENNREVRDHRLDRIEAQLKKMNTLMENIFKCVQISHTSTSFKPTILPISSVAGMRAFENLDEEAYSNVINYFHYIGGFNLKEAINLCLKESLQDSFTPSLTWWGREENQEPLYNARLTKAIYSAVCRNQHFQRPQRSEFQVHMRDALRAAKERYRHKERKQQRMAAGPRIQRDLWNDEYVEEAEEEL